MPKSFCHVLVCKRDGEVIKDIEEFFSGLEDMTIAFEASSNYEYFLLLMFRRRR
jgi:hypothetical protein